jgi:mannose-6-phosphate isomerase
LKSILYPLLFKPVFQERIWGGRNIEILYKKELPPQIPIGESWEISDRPEAQSVVINGPLAGKTLHWILENHPQELLGEAESFKGRFPLLVKILDARERLSLQVHPPASKAEALRGEPKTEMWYITRAEPNAKLYVGLRKGTTKVEFEKRIGDGTVAECFHQIEVRAGDMMFLPSGRVHAIGAGLLIYEIQQNSDTTYRVFDWNRTDAQGKPRQLHLKESLDCIDFEDFEPEIIRPEPMSAEGAEMHIQTLVEHALFNVEIVNATSVGQMDYSVEKPRIIGVVEGEIRVENEDFPINIRAGQFCLVPADQRRARIVMPGAARFLVAQPG